MSRFWNRKTKSISPYVPGEQPRARDKYIKLNTNENPYPPSPKIGAFLTSFEPEELRLYPEVHCYRLKKALADSFGLVPEQIFCGNGSDEVLAVAFQAFFERGEEADPIIFPDITYSFYKVYAELYDIPYRTIPLETDFSLPLKAFKGFSGGIVLANPNAPTGLAIPQEELLKIIQANPDQVVLVDEAYVDFGGESALSLLGQCPNLIVVGTLSKSASLAGLRIGYACASPELIQGLERIRDSFNSYPVDTLAMELGALAVEDREWTMSNVVKIIATRSWVEEALLERGFSVIPSKTNFLLVKPKGIQAEILYKNLKEEGILVRYFATPRLKDYLRITIGTDAEMDSLIKAIDGYISKV